MVVLAAWRVENTLSKSQRHQINASSAVFEQLLESTTSWNPSAWGWQGGLDAEPLYEIYESVISLILANGMARTALNETLLGSLRGGKN